jgi:hypothetical protein
MLWLGHGGMLMYTLAIVIVTMVVSVALTLWVLNVSDEPVKQREEQGPMRAAFDMLGIGLTWLVCFVVAACALVVAPFHRVRR